MADEYLKQGMFPTTMLRFMGVVLLVSSSIALAQNERVVEIPWPGTDAGVQVEEAPGPTPKVVVLPADPPPMPPLEGTPDAPPPTDQDTGGPRVIEATPPLPPPPEQLEENPKQAPPPGPGAMIDGHPREGAFLSGPGSLTFVLHHSLMTGLGVLATQMIPRILQAECVEVPDPNVPCVKDASRWTGQDARVAYLAGSLLGAGIGFGAAAWWQFNHWISHRTANFGIVTSFFGGAFLGGITDAITQGQNSAAIAWTVVVGNSLAAWLTAIVGGGDLAMNKGAMIVSGGVWAAIYTGLILAIIATTGGGAVSRGGLDAVLITPAIGAGAMALATLRFNPSTTQVMRANLFGVGAGGLVLLISGLVLGANFTHSPVPYILGGLAAIGAKTVVSLLWAEAVDSNAQAWAAPASDRRYRGVW
jgi:hypothetical protein